MAHPPNERCTIDGNFAAIREEIRNRHGDGLIEQNSHNNRFSRLVLGPSFGSGFLEFLSLDDELSVVILNGCFKEVQPFKLGGQEWLRFHFRISGNNTLVFGNDIKYELGGTLAQVMVMPEDVEHVDYISSSNMQMISIYCGRRFLIDELGIDPDLFPRPIGDFIAYKKSVLDISNLKCSREVHDALLALFRSCMAGNMRPAYLRSKALELICLFTSEMQSVPIAEDVPLSSRERQRIHDLFERVAAAPGEPWRIPDIARDVGMNRNKLTKAFRDSFGFSIYEHVQRSRLHLATKLLKEGELSIAQIALDVGYSHQSTFTSAFRSVLGVSPLKYRSRNFMEVA